MNRRKFISYIGCSCCSLLINQCSTVPITDRIQLSIIPESSLNKQAAQIYEKVKQKEKLSDDLNQLEQIKEIGNRIEGAVSEYFLAVPYEFFESYVVFFEIVLTHLLESN